MSSKFRFYPVEKTYTDPVTAVFKPAIPFGKKYFKGDLVLMHPEIMGSKVFLNSNILREAILNSKELLEERLGLVIEDATKSEKPKKKTTAKKVEKVEEVLETPKEEPVEEPKKEEEPSVDALEVEDLITE